VAKGKALAIPVPGPGRKSLYREQYAEQAFKLCLLGAKDEELANFFGVAVKTLFNCGDSGAAYRWLLNRRRQDWADKQVHEITGTVIHEHRAAAEAEVADMFGPTPHEITLNG
jgi:hypothetical protein